MLSNLGLGLGAGFQNWRLGRRLTLAAQLLGLQRNWAGGELLFYKAFVTLGRGDPSAEEMLQRDLSIVVKKIPGLFHKVKGKRKLR